ncbi:unnamed protein product [Chondrus crispus]|uniref:DUF7733 domain-containing protein n=1 Tax=Chondrus crispus TaxID=2769 RepID=R7QGX8_CHOCR|nr:unnamed protein product [Chondrus crispus]CDF37782.1 unnamed protein product [Chondrus crispus]|eukprot:XP_005717653.1 unnamed protein product [Chondrus crispus]
MLYLAVYLRAVPLSHVLFVCVTAGYASLANYFVLRDSNSFPAAPLRPRSLSPTKNSTRLLFPFTLFLSLVGPAVLLTISPATSQRPSQLQQVIAPHLFLMLSQIVMETIGFLLFNSYVLYVRLGVTIAMVSYRLRVIVTWYHMAVAWTRSVEASKVLPFVPSLVQATAVLNLVFWSFSLLCYLLLYCLPAVCREPNVSDEHQKVRCSVPGRPL